MSFEYNRPRRPSPDTLSYLRSLPLEERVSDEEVKTYMDFFANKNNNKDDNDQQEMIDEPEYPRVLSAALSAIDEIKNEVASLAGDEYGSECIEVLTRVGAKYSAFAAKSLLEGVAGYYLHLATHRYGSHVLQTIIQLASKGCGGDYDYSESQLASTLELEEGDLTTDNDHTTSSLQNLIISAVQELLPYVPNLAVHICGSHVLRTLLCALSGVELVTTSQLSSNTNDSSTIPIRRGKAKKKKKKKKKASDEPSNNNNSNPGLIQLKKLQTTRINVLDPNVQKAFHSLVDAISMVSPDNNGSSSGQGVSPPGEFQQLACHPSASPLLIVVLRVLIEVDDNKPLNTDETKEDGKDFFKLGIIPPQPQFQPNSRAEDFAKSIICWDSDPTITAKDQKYAGDIIYGLSGESRGSHMLETLLRTANDTFYDAICKTGDFFNPSTFNDYIAHDVSNFVIQTLLSTVRTKSQAESLLQCIQPSIENGYILHSSNKRRGVLWRTVEMAAKFGVGQETIQNCIKVGFSTNHTSDNNNNNNNNNNGMKEVPSKEDNQGTKEEEDGKKRRKKRPIASSVSMEECVPKLLDIKPPEYDGGRVGLDVAGTRTIHHLLKFNPRLCGDVLNGIINNLSQQELEWIINDGLGSRW